MTAGDWDDGHENLRVRWDGAGWARQSIDCNGAPTLRAYPF